MIWIHGRRDYVLMTGAAVAIALAHVVNAAEPATTPSSAGPFVGDNEAQNTTPTTAGFNSNLTGNWQDRRQQLLDAGIGVGATFTAEGFDNFEGGLRTGHPVGATTFDFDVTLDGAKLIHLPGGELYVDLEDHAFRNPTTALVGDLQVFDKQNSAPYLQIFELWYQQKLFDNKVRIKVGKVDANTEFSLIDDGLPFISSSTQVSPTIFMFPTTPDPMPSVNIFVTPTESYYVNFGAYYANRSDRFGDLVDDPAKAQFTNSGAFLIGESGLRWRKAVLGNAGNLKAGIWGDTGIFTGFDGTQKRGTFGYYAIVDQTVWQPQGEPDNGRGVRAFFEYGGTENDINVINRHLGGGVTWTGPIEARASDILGVSPQYAHISSEAGLRYPYEMAIETFYQWEWTPWAFVQPDLQYIVHPGGTHPNALVATLRIQISL